MNAHTGQEEVEPTITADTRDDLQKIMSSMREVEAQLDDLQATHLGHRLITLAREAAVKAGKAEGMELVEMFELSEEREKLNKDARSLLRAWTASWGPEELEIKLELFSINSITGLKASRRLVDHYNEVLGAFETASNLSEPKS
ncbi:hypothetical protein SAMN05216206_1942 [Pseudomonas guineae]|uniref:Uncharacterized protein n=1 Tax=Pseudomonas guineae TaxID=425504 RepID=A0A1I3HFB8_9PSED|nr:hypothetical protein [Pseudomonas guineae]SFI34257.1 hypothetical protein SAMN05216206_1942 [Pseudomonas guineae]